MNALLASAIVSAMWFPAPRTRQAEEWQPFTSMDSRIRFEMPRPPQEQVMKSASGTVRIFVCKKDELVFQTVAMELNKEVQTAMQEAVSDSETSVARQILDESIQGFVDGTEAKLKKTEYGRYLKLPNRTSIAEFTHKQEASLMSVVAKSHAYLFIVIGPKSAANDLKAKRFMDSIRFEN